MCSFAASGFLRQPRIARRERQRGAALLVLLTLVVVVSASVVLNQLNTAVATRVQDLRETSDALQEAKAALIGFAASYPDNFAGFGPGFLPCPDTNGNGSPNPPCGPDAIGRLPWSYLGATDLVDASGARLWYALSDNFRNNPKIAVLNSDTPGQLAVDGQGDIVAIVFAPGPALDGQPRDLFPNVVANYLEADNNSNGDQSFVTRDLAGNPFNDRLVVIRRGEFMAAIERRVLGEVAGTLARYRDLSAAPNLDNPNWNDRNVYPWLAPFAQPVASNFKSAFINPLPGPLEGHLALHWPGEVFPVTFEPDWDVNNATVNANGSVSASALEDDEFTVTGTCTWTGDPAVFDCSALRPRTATCLGNPGIDISRSYRFQYAGLYKIRRPKRDRLRERRPKVNKDNFLPPGTAYSITIVDTATSGPDSGSICGNGTLVSDSDTTGKFKLKDIPYDLGVPNELPQWFIDNLWHHLIYIAEANGHSPGRGAGVATCTPGPAGDCLQVIQRTGQPPSNDKHALVLVAGGELVAQNRAGTGALNDYFEGENSNQDIVFDRSLGSDQARIVAP